MFPQSFKPFNIYICQSIWPKIYKPIAILKYTIKYIHTKFFFKIINLTAYTLAGFDTNFNILPYPEELETAQMPFLQDMTENM